MHMDKTSRTDAQWAAIIDETEHSLHIRRDSYPYPAVHSPAFSKTIDHTLLKLDAQVDQFRELCSEAKAERFATVCVRPAQVEACVAELRGTEVGVASVIGFHEGTYETRHKAQHHRRETAAAVSSGATELDVVINYPQLKAGAYALVHEELCALREHARAQGDRVVVLKLILETSQLDRRQIVAGCVLAAHSGFQYVKTSTGFNGAGATEDDVRLMAACCDRLVGDGSGDGKMLVKASGGIRTLAAAVQMLEAGASRLGTSAGMTIVKEARQWAADGANARPITSASHPKAASTEY